MAKSLWAFCFGQTMEGNLRFVGSYFRSRTCWLHPAVKETFPGITSSACIEIDEVADQIEAFLQGGDIRFSLEGTRFGLCSMFQKWSYEPSMEYPEDT